MPQMPKRVKFRKSQRGKIKGNATRGNSVTFGEYGLQSLEGGWLSAEAIEAGRITATHSVRGEGRLYIRVFPHKSVTAIPAETRMGKGKGEPEYWAAVIKPGMILFEIGGLPETAARDCLAAWPTRCRFGAASCRADPTYSEAGMKTEEYRGMSIDQLRATLKEQEKNLFHLRFQSATDRLETPSEIRKAKREVARILTIQGERERAAQKTATGTK